MPQRMNEFRLAVDSCRHGRRHIMKTSMKNYGRHNKKILIKKRFRKFGIPVRAFQKNVDGQDRMKEMIHI